MKKLLKAVIGLSIIVTLFSACSKQNIIENNASLRVLRYEYISSEEKKPQPSSLSLLGLLTDYAPVKKEQTSGKTLYADFHALEKLVPQSSISIFSKPSFSYGECR